jgi:HAD superfamily hydrolase (TIGR01509 family)
VTHASIILWDVMGTLVHDPFFVEVPQFFGMPLHELIAVKHPTSWLRFEHGEIDEAQVIREFFADRRSFDGEGLKAAMRSAYRFLPGIEPLLQQLHAAGVPMHALSNYSQWYELIEEAVSLSRWVQWSFVSCKTGVRKPAAAAYEAALAALGVPASQCLFIDDREVNCEGARAVGMHAVRFTSVTALEPELARLGLG